MFYLLQCVQEDAFQFANNQQQEEGILSMQQMHHEH
jgi:hypothetical protein